MAMFGGVHFPADSPGTISIAEIQKRGISFCAADSFMYAAEIRTMLRASEINFLFAFWGRL